MKATLFAAALLFLSGSVSEARKITVSNKCNYKIWVGMFTDPSNNKVIPKQPTGWEAPPGHSTSFDVPDDWASGRIWGRTKCDFSKRGAIACATGSCNGGLECDKKTGTGVPPVSLAELTLGRNGQPDNYDVSFVDGFNIPMALIPTGGCHAVECKKNLNTKCPHELQLKVGNDVAGCKTACTANLDGNPGNSANCCSGSHSTPQTCPISGVKFYDYFKQNCHDAYAYAYDDKTSLFTCPKDKKADYHVVFCP